MATNDNNRVTKDTSARKNPPPPSMLFTGIQEAAQKAAEEVAQEAMQRAYLENLAAGYEAQIQATETKLNNQINLLKEEHANQLSQHSSQVSSLKDEHAKEISKHNDWIVALKKQHEKEISELKAGQEKTTASSTAGRAKAENALHQAKLSAMAEGAAKARQESQANVSELLAKINARDGEIAELNKQLEKKVADCAKTTAATDALLLKKSRAIVELQRRVSDHPSSWIQVHFDRKHGKRRTYFRKPDENFREAVEELGKAAGLKYERTVFRRPDNNGYIDGSKSLAQVR